MSDDKPKNAIDMPFQAGSVLVSQGVPESRPSDRAAVIL